MLAAAVEWGRSQWSRKGQHSWRQHFWPQRVTSDPHSPCLSLVTMMARCGRVPRMGRKTGAARGSAGREAAQEDGERECWGSETRCGQSASCSRQPRLPLSKANILCRASHLFDACEDGGQQLRPGGAVAAVAVSIRYVSDFNRGRGLCCRTRALTSPWSHPGRPAPGCRRQSRAPSYRSWLMVGCNGVARERRGLARAWDARKRVRSLGACARRNPTTEVPHGGPNPCCGLALWF